MAAAATLWLHTLFTLVASIDARHVLQHRHEALALQNDPRQDSSDLPTSSIGLVIPSTTNAAVLTYITPSPGASPVAVTEQSQVVTTYAPQYTLCELPDVTFFPETISALATRTAAPYKNVTFSVSPNSDSCSTVYSTLETTVCATTLTGLASQIPITACDEDVTFSMEYGFTLVAPTSSYNAKRQMASTKTYSNGSSTITPPPTLETLTTYYLAPWTELTAGTAPADVTRKVCSALLDGTEECVREYETWYTTPVTVTTTSIVSINFTTTIHGPSRVIIYETGIANVTEQVATISMATLMEMEYETEIESTATVRRSVSTSTGPTVYETITLEEATPPAVPTILTTTPSSSDSLTTTYTIKTTMTTTVGTTTVTLSTAPTLSPA